MVDILEFKPGIDDGIGIKPGKVFKYGFNLQASIREKELN